MNDFLVSVIIPVYNPGKHLYKCLDSIINQTYKSIELILVDDGSTDGSSEVCDEYAKKDSRITVIHQENGGVSKARNAGIRIATGDYYYFPDSDDYIDLDCFEYCLNLMNEYKCDIVSFEYYTTYSDREVQHKSNDDLYGLFDIEGSHKAVLKGVPFACNRLYSKKAVNGVFFREDIYRGEDSIFVHNCINQIEKAYFDKRAMYHYVQSEESAVRGKFRPSQLTVLKLFDEYKSLLKEYPVLIDYAVKYNMNSCISIYYDMFSDENDYKSEMKKVHSVIKKQFNELKHSNSFSNKERIKYDMFCLSPSLFCKIHKLINKL